MLTLLLERGEMQIDELNWYADVPPGRMPSILLDLEFRDVIRQTPGEKKFRSKSNSALLYLPDSSGSYRLSVSFRSKSNSALLYLPE
ncbi:MAG: hypothetical protein LRY55_06595 [Leadbetterella sp.]|nr:hypothetical protein [Leadbetterella sp.]